MHPLPPLHTHTPYLYLPLSLDHNCIALGAVQKPHHSPEGGGVRRWCEKGVRQVGRGQTHV